MSITLQTLFEETAKTYNIRLLAGQAGLNQIVSWVHIIEDESIADFLVGNELIFTTGIRRADCSWILPFCKALKNAGSVGLVLNTGPYISVISQTVIDFCNAASFPLFTTPWESKLVQITQTYGFLIMENETMEVSINNAFKEIIFNPSSYHYCISTLLQHGYSETDKYTVTCLSLSPYTKNTHDINVKRALLYIEMILKRYCPRNSFASFYLSTQLVIVLTQAASPFLRQIMEQVIQVFKEELHLQVNAGTGVVNDPLTNLRDNYHLAQKASELSMKLDASYLFYEDLGVYKLLLQQSQERIISDFYEDTLKDLIEYDKYNHTDYLNFLESYIACDFSIHALAAKTFLHRNTVYYKLGKIESILNQDLNHWNTRLNLILCLCIKNLL
ncbi:PucR family transcriptional regulator [Lactonifactor longoviformis]|uniref:PucR family transcriptional regulator n=1 Tax=Lactonifactor longoviformis TaxID=341220 RepID=UPI0036F1F76A